MAARQNPKELKSLLKRKRRVAGQAEGKPVSELGLTEEEVNHLYFKFQSFREGWEAQGMEAYDDL